jgi:hypothetical protein
MQTCAIVVDSERATRALGRPDRKGAFVCILVVGKGLDVSSERRGVNDALIGVEYDVEYLPANRNVGHSKFLAS